jgi:hypothetical protein
MMEDRVSALETELAGLNLKLLQIAWKMDDIDKRIPEEPSETSEEPSEISDVEVYDIRGKLIVVENELSEIRTRIGVMNKLISTYENPDIDLPDTNIVSHSLWKRCGQYLDTVSWEMSFSPHGLLQSS